MRWPSKPLAVYGRLGLPFRSLGACGSLPWPPALDCNGMNKSALCRPAGSGVFGQHLSLSGLLSECCHGNRPLERVASGDLWFLSPTYPQTAKATLRPVSESARIIASLSPQDRGPGIPQLCRLPFLGSLSGPLKHVTFRGYQAGPQRGQVLQGQTGQALPLWPAYWQP